MMEEYKRIIDEVDFTAEAFDDPDGETLIAFTISSGDIYTRAFLKMDRVIELHKFLTEEIESYLTE